MVIYITTYTQGQQKRRLEALSSREGFVNSSRRGLVLGVICAAGVSLAYFLFCDNLTIGAVTAALAVILVYFVSGHFP